MKRSRLSGLTSFAQPRDDGKTSLDTGGPHGYSHVAESARKVAGGDEVEGTPVVK